MHKPISKILIFVLVCQLFFPQGIFADPLESESEFAIPVLALAGFRMQETPEETRFRNHLFEVINHSKKVQFIPEVVTGGIINHLLLGERREAEETLQQAYKDFMAGKEFYQQLAMDSAITVLGRSVNGYREGIAGLRENQNLLFSHLYLGMALITLGREVEGKRYIREMIILDSARKERKLSQREFSPKIISIHKALTQEILRNPSGEVRISVQPSDAKVFWDGVAQKSSSLVISGVPKGDHFILVERRGYKHFLRRVSIVPGVTPIEVKLEKWNPLSPYSSTNQANPEEKVKMLERLSKELATQILVLGDVVTENQVEVAQAQLFDARTKEFSKIEKEVLPINMEKTSAEKLGKSLLGNLSSTGIVIGEPIDSSLSIPSPNIETWDGRSSFPKEPSPSKSSWELHRQWWFWTLLGLAVAGGAGVYFMTREQEADSSILTIPNPLR